VSDWTIEPLASHHVRNGFDCGEPSLSEWFRHQASQFGARDLAKVYVLVRPGDPRVLGYYSISTYHIHFEAIPPKRSRSVAPG
jgi:hypothetical protein